MAMANEMKTTITLVAKRAKRERRGEGSGPGAPPEAPKRAVTQSHGFTVFVCVYLCVSRKKETV